MSLLQAYGILTLMIFSWACIFFIREYAHRGGSVSKAIKCGLAMAVALLPMGLAVLLYAGGITWPRNKVVWFTYACSITAYLIWAVIQDIRSQRGNVERLIKFFREAPLPAAIAWFSVLAATIPPYAILWIYATQ